MQAIWCGEDTQQTRGWNGFGHHMQGEASRLHPVVKWVFNKDQYTGLEFMVSQVPVRTLVVCKREGTNLFVLKEKRESRWKVHLIG